MISRVAKWTPLAAFIALCGCTAVLMSACSSEKQAAQQALDNAAGAAYVALSPDADKYASEDVTALQKELEDLKSSFDMKDYAGVIATAPEVRTAATQLSLSVATKKEADAEKWLAEWTEASGALPKVLASVHSRVDKLSKSRHPPKNVNLPTARADLADAESLWEKAEGSYGAGKTAAAVATTKEVMAKAEAGAAAVNMTLPEAPAK
jgi:hypothetical protein